jgi:hypothetical protein
MNLCVVAVVKCAGLAGEVWQNGQQIQKKVVRDDNHPEAHTHTNLNSLFPGLFTTKPANIEHLLCVLTAHTDPIRDPD